MANLRGSVLIVTGSTGIAAAAVRQAAAGGARVVVASGDDASAWELAAETGAECWVGDLARGASADSVLSQCLSRFGRVDALFNAAGLSGRRFGDGPVHECSDEGWELTLAHNLKTTFLMCRAVTARMLQQEVSEAGIRGAIVNTGSILADSPEPRHFDTHAYAAAKGAIAAMSRSMAAYYAPHKIRVNAIAPGLVRTPASERAAAGQLGEFLRKKQPLSSGMIEAEDAARAALFLLSEDARPITGEVLAVDGGWRITGA
ncbi:MAG TPA: SDR family oxidoreductase [Bryobacteraceae bacterium]|nr:SDR family oxidoreductase [Bryobacteraceae bacterium]